MAPSIRRVSPADVPQANSLDQIRRVLAAISLGNVAVQDISASTGISDRHVNYALRSANTLRLIRFQGASPVLAALGSALLGTEARSPDEAEVFGRAIRESTVISSLAPDLLSRKAPKRASLSARIRKASGLSPTTSDRRAQALLSWRKQLAGPARRQLTLEARQRSLIAPKKLPSVVLSDDLRRDLFRDNPWWEGKPGPVLPSTQRDVLATIVSRLRSRVAPIVVVRGPRQVGKTTAQLQLIEQLMSEGVPPTHILRVQFDEVKGISQLAEPIPRIVDWYESTILGSSLNETARRGVPAYLLFDEIQNLPDWAAQLKHLVDASSVLVVVTGSSALRIEQGRDSLAGRISTIEVGTLSLREIAAIRFGVQLKRVLSEGGIDRLARREFWVEVQENGMSERHRRDQAFAAFSQRGGYPLVHKLADVSWHDVAEQLNETVIRKVIRHDLRVGDRGRKRDPALLEELFRLGCRYAGQAPGVRTFVSEVQKALAADVGAQRVRHYLDFLDRALLLRSVRPLEIRLKRAHGDPKLCLADHGLRASWLQEYVPLEISELAKNIHLSDIAGRVAESIVGAYLLTISGLPIAHFPARHSDPEVDYVLTVGPSRIPLEVKYRRHIDPMGDTEGLRHFMQKPVYNAPFGVLVTQTDDVVINDPRIVVVSLPSLLLMR